MGHGRAAWEGVGGKRVILTGATSGIGLAGAKVLAAKGARLAIVARSETKARKALDELSANGSAVDVLMADLSSLASVRKLAEEILESYPRIDVLVNNAGAINSSRQLTEDGYELTWAVNHLAPFLLTNLLLERLRRCAPARVVTTSSDAHKGATLPFDDLNAEKSYRAFTRYGQTKLANIAFTSELGRRLEGSGVTANCFHPGLVATGFNRNNGLGPRLAMMVVRPFSRSPEKGAETLVALVDSPEYSHEQGGYFVDGRRVEPTAPSLDAAAARRLWEISAVQTNLDA